MSRPPADDPHVPANWDRLLSDAEDGDVAPPGPPAQDTTPQRLTLVAAAWGDLVAIVAMLTAALVAVLFAGRPVTVVALPWTGALAIAWWLAAACVLLVVRRATPGMLMAGVVLRAAPAPRRLPWIVLTALLTAASGGVLALLGARHAPVARVAGTEIVLAQIAGGLA